VTLPRIFRNAKTNGPQRAAEVDCCATIQVILIEGFHFILQTYNMIRHDTKYEINVD